MNKFEQLKVAIGAIPDEFYWVKHGLEAQLEAGRLERMAIYSLGLYHMAEALTSDEEILTPLREIREILK